MELLLHLAAQVLEVYKDLRITFISYRSLYYFIYQVPYYDKIQNVESKLDHITASVKSHEYQQPDLATRGHIAMNGFNDKDIFKDALFRLGLALREAGVHNSAAARDVIRSLHVRPQAPI